MHKIDLPTNAGFITYTAKFVPRLSNYFLIIYFRRFLCDLMLIMIERKVFFDDELSLQAPRARRI